jgi:hypothetical protein
VHNELTTARHVDHLLDAYAGVVSTVRAAPDAPQASNA